MTRAETGEERGARGIPLSAVLFRLAHDRQRDRVAIRDLLEAPEDRAIGALMFVFAVPNVLPMPPGVSAILGAPLVFLSAQLMLGRRPWLPAVIAGRSLSREDFATLMRRVVPWLVKAERLLRPRASWLARPPMEYLVGLACLLLAVVLVLPIPLGNSLPALAISLLALGVLERDGFWIIAGGGMCIVAATVVSGIVFVLVQGAVLMLTRMFS